MTSTRGRCTNFDYCGLADRRRDIAVRLSDAFVCPECGNPLRPPPVGQGGGGRGRILLAIAVLVVLAGGAGAYLRFGGTAGLPSLVQSAQREVTALTGTAATPPAPATPAPAPQPQATASVQTPAPALKPTAPPAPAPHPPASQTAMLQTPPAPPVLPAVKETVVLRMAGSNTVGAVLGPRLAQAFLGSTGDSNVAIEPTGKPDEVRVVGQRGDAREVITVAAHGSATAFTDLAHGAADVGMSSRRIKPAEAEALRAVGDMTSAQHEHVLALDGIAVIVNPANPVASLTKAQLHDIFTGAITNWSQVGGPAGDIHVFARDDKSGTYDTFKALVLGSGKLTPTARRVEDSRELSGDVATDPAAIGFIGLPYVLSARPVPVADVGALPLLPNRLTVGTEDYALARRLFLYTGSAAPGAAATRFAAFALSPAGQVIAEDTGFVPLTVKPEATAVPQAAPDRFRQLVGHATRLSTNFRFQPNSVALDNRAERDLDRLVNFVVSAHARPEQIVLVGFADNKGSVSGNLAVSKRRAEAIAQGLAQRGLRITQVAAFGSELPVADNGTDDGREKNRRVEVYMKL